ncbi:MAG: hypothetical protein ABIT23_05170, partial [Nitrosospira sp.]
MRLSAAAANSASVNEHVLCYWRGRRGWSINISGRCPDKRRGFVMTVQSLILLVVFLATLLMLAY